MRGNWSPWSDETSFCLSSRTGDVRQPETTGRPLARPLPRRRWRRARPALRPRVDAQAWLDTVTGRADGTYVDPAKAKITVGEWTKRWQAGQAHLKPSTCERYAGIVREHIEPRWSQVMLLDVSRMPTCRHGSPSSAAVGRQRRSARFTGCSR